MYGLRFMPEINECTQIVFLILLKKIYLNNSNASTNILRPHPFSIFINNLLILALWHQAPVDRSLIVTTTSPQN